MQQRYLVFALYKQQLIIGEQGTACMAQWFSIYFWMTQCQVKLLKEWDWKRTRNRQP